MADPITGTMAAIGIGTSLFGGFTQAAGAKTQAQAQAADDQFKSQEAQYQASVAMYNSTIAKQNASWATASGEVEAQQAGISTREDIGQIRAAQGAGNLDVNSGTNAEVRAAQMEVGQENMALLRSDAARKAFGYEVQAYQDVQQAGWENTASSYYQTAAGYAQTAGDISATSSILGGIGKAASMGLSSYKSGIFGGGGGGTSLLPPD